MAARRPAASASMQENPSEMGGQVEGLKGVSGDGSGGSEGSIADGMVGIIFYGMI